MIFEKLPIKPHRDNINNNENRNENQPLILKLIRQMLDSKDGQVSSNQSEDKASDTSRIQNDEAYALILSIRQHYQADGEKKSIIIHQPQKELPRGIILLGELLC